MKFKVIIVFFLLSFTQNSNSENKQDFVEIQSLNREEIGLLYHKTLF